MKLKQVRRDGWCRHRTPLTRDYPTCKVGVDFHQFDFRACPCLGDNTPACEKFEGWTPEEVAAKEREHDAFMARLFTIRPAIVARIKETGVRRGTIPCPSCKVGTVVYSQASNGHVMAKCSTDGCMSWME